MIIRRLTLYLSKVEAYSLRSHSFMAFMVFSFASRFYIPAKKYIGKPYQRIEQTEMARST